jgi:hypothetical protein
MSGNGEKMGLQWVHELFIDFKWAYDSVRREVLCNIFMVFGVPMKLIRLIKMYSGPSVISPAAERL